MFKILNTIAAFSLVAGMSSGAMAKDPQAYALFSHYDLADLKGTFLFKCNGGGETDSEACKDGASWLGTQTHNFKNEEPHRGIKFKEYDCRQLANAVAAENGLSSEEGGRVTDWILGEEPTNPACLNAAFYPKE